ncbi:MAG: glycosyltransferase family 4 protein [Planctomycetota bacterium]
MIGTHRVVRTDGQGRVCLEVAAAAAERGWRVTLLCDRADEDLASHPAVRFVRVPAAGLPGQLLRQAAYARRLTAALPRPAGPDTVVLLNGDIAGGAPSDLNVAHFVHSAYRRHLRVRGLRSVYHRAYAEQHARGERTAFAAAWRAVAVSARVRDELVQEVGVPEEKVVVIPNGVDLKEFHPLRDGEERPLRELAGCSDDELLALFVGDLRSERKGFGTVLQAVAQTPGVRVVAVGGQDGGPFPAMAKRLGITDRVVFLGRRDDVPGLMRQADVFVFPSAYEPFGLVVTEALASGVPVVCGPEVGAAPHAGDGGVMLRGSGDVEGLVAALSGLRDDADERGRRSIAARSAAEACGWGAMASAYLELAEAALEAKQVG